MKKKYILACILISCLEKEQFYIIISQAIGHHAMITSHFKKNKHH